MSNGNGLNPVTAYEFRSVTGQMVTIRSRLGEQAARKAAMEHLWGDRVPTIPSERGSGLDLVSNKVVR